MLKNLTLDASNEKLKDSSEEVTRTTLMWRGNGEPKKYHPKLRVLLNQSLLASTTSCLKLPIHSRSISSSKKEAQTPSKLFEPFTHERDTMGRLLPLDCDQSPIRHRSLPHLSKNMEGPWTSESKVEENTDKQSKFNWGKTFFCHKMNTIEESKKYLVLVQAVNRMKKAEAIQDTRESTLPNSSVLNSFKEILRNRSQKPNLKRWNQPGTVMQEKSNHEVSYSQVDKKTQVFVYKKVKTSVGKHEEASSIENYLSRKTKPSVINKTDKLLLKPLVLKKSAADATQKSIASFDDHGRKGFKPNCLKSTFEKHPAKHSELGKLMQEDPSITWNKMSVNYVLNEVGLHRATNDILKVNGVKKSFTLGIKKTKPN